jgi:hypothetical protein
MNEKRRRKKNRIVVAGSRHSNALWRTCCLLVEDDCALVYQSPLCRGSTSVLERAAVYSALFRQLPFSPIGIKCG